MNKLFFQQVAEQIIYLPLFAEQSFFFSQKTVAPPPPPHRNQMVGLTLKDRLNIC